MRRQQITVGEIVKKKDLENLSRTYPLVPDTDRHGAYILYCTYHYHPGVVVPKQREVCERENCSYLLMFREEDLI